jgi:archaellum component FlaC
MYGMVDLLEQILNELKGINGKLDNLDSISSGFERIQDDMTSIETTIEQISRDITGIDLNLDSMINKDNK